MLIGSVQTVVLQIANQEGRNASSISAVVLVRFASVFGDGRTIGLVFSSAAFDDAVAEGGRRQTFVIGSAVVVLGRLAHVLAILLVRAVPAVVVAIANKIQRHAHFTGASELVHPALLIGASVVLV